MNKHTASLGDAVEANDEEEELTTLVEVLGTELAQSCAHKHLLSNLIDATQRGYWRM